MQHHRTYSIPLTTTTYKLIHSTWTLIPLFSLNAVTQHHHLDPFNRSALFTSKNLTYVFVAALIANFHNSSLTHDTETV